MARTQAQIASVDPVWTRIIEEARDAIREEPLLGGLIHSSILHHPTMERALGYRIDDRWSVLGGWRYLSIDKDDGSNSIDVTQSGAIVGLSYSF